MELGPPMGKPDLRDPGESERPTNRAEQAPPFSSKIGVAMSHPNPSNIHPSALIDPKAELGEGVTVGPQAIIEGPAKIGPDCVIKAHAYVCGNVTMGRGNVVFSGAVIGEQPQHVRYAGEQTAVEIGDDNVFRENVTIHRGTSHSWLTKIGSRNFFMAGAHVAHDCQIGNDCILANNALVGGHCFLADKVFLSGNSAVHQWVRVGRLAFLSGCSATTKDIPPFFVQQGIDNVVGVNLIGMKRAGLKGEQIDGVKTAFRYLCRKQLTLPAAILQIEAELGHIDTVQEMLAFLHDCPKGINPMRSRKAA